MSSVHTSRRILYPDPQFLETSMDIVLETYTRLEHFPKRYTFTLSKYIEDAANNSRSEILLANNIRIIKVREDYFERTRHFRNAIGYLNVLGDKVDLAYELFSRKHEQEKSKMILTDQQIFKWHDLINREKKLIAGVMNSDKQRYKDLPSVISL